MSRLMERPAIRRLATATLAIAGLCAVSAMSNPADARVWVSFGYPGYSAPYYGYSYRPYYPAYYGYGYGYGWRWRHRHWCYWHPYRC